MRFFRTVCAFSLLFSSTGCILSSNVASLAEHTRQGKPEVITATTRTQDKGGDPFAVVALEASCRVTPGDPEGGPGARGYVLKREPAQTDDEKRFLDEHELSYVSSYRAASAREAESDPDRLVPEGFPDRVLLGEGKDEKAQLFLGDASGWRALPVERYVHADRESGSPVLAGFEVALLAPPAMVIDLATFPIEWFIAAIFPVTPP